ncbi:MAG TPA: hypothetical protein VKA76_06320 [Gammaproteobacteria bacterium]|nr:hypothetical protein [Gammaproteobacteria bacterium]
MRHYDNLPVMVWEDDRSAMRVRAQLLHEEPLILNMGNPFVVDAADESCGCRPQMEGDRYLGCDPQRALAMLAAGNGWGALNAVGQAAAQAGFVADLEPSRGRIVLHD